MNTTYGYASGEFRINVYRVHIPDDAEPKLNVHQNAAWVTPAEMDNYEFPPADTDIIRLENGRAVSGKNCFDGLRKILQSVFVIRKPPAGRGSLPTGRQKVRFKEPAKTLFRA